MAVSGRGKLIAPLYFDYASWTREASEFRPELCGFRQKSWNESGHRCHTGAIFETRRIRALFSRHWLRATGIKTLYIDPGSPWQNGFIESFHSRFRAECLDREQLWTLSEARVVIEDWRREYNEKRSHKSLRLETPRAFAIAASQAAASGRATPSLRPQLDITSLVERYFNPNTNPTRLTFPVGQFG